MSKTDLNAKIINKAELGPGQFILRVAPVGWALPDFVAGQYSVLGLPGSAPRSIYSDPEDTPADPDKLIRRAYSISSSSVEKEYLEYYISLVRSGALTPRLFALNIGDPIWMSPKCVGMLTLEDIPTDTNVILIATGTGLAPYISMLRTMLQTVGINRKIAVIHGARHSWDLGYRSELEMMERLSDKFAYMPIISSPEEEHIPWKGLTGFVKDAWESKELKDAFDGHPDPENTHVYLCGNPLMIDMALEMLGAEGYTEHSRKQPGNIHLEKFW